MLNDRKPWDDISPLEVDALSRALDNTDYAPLSREVGRFVMAWSQLDQAISILLQKLCPRSEIVEFAVLSGQLDVYSKCRAALALSGRTQRPEGWHDDLANLCKRIEGPFREERNRIVHDTWLAEDGKFTRLFYRPRPAKDGQPPSIIDETPITVEEIQLSTARLVLSGNLVKRLCDQLDA